MPSIIVNGVTYELPPDDSQAQKIPQLNSAIQALATETGAPNVKKVRVYHSTTQSLTTATLTAISFDSERYDNDTIHDNVTNNTRLTCKTAGLYLITANVGFAANVTGIRALEIELNGATNIANINHNAVGAGATRLAISTVYQLAVNDYVRAMAYQDSGGALNTDRTLNACPEFAMTRLGA